MKTWHAVLLAVVGVAHIAQRQVHQRQQAEIAVTQLHQDWLGQLIERPHLAVQWGLDGMNEEEMVHTLSANQQLSALGLRDRLGLLRGPRLDFVADAFVQKQIGRRYWDRCGAYREEEAAGDRAAERFCRALKNARRAYPKTDPVGV
ncbi:DUF6082 family protein [Streptomyces sp. NPDC059850]|uniref:DUF6082 family protein n=1 Tax=Streptomyces sp. NPDC059850 TaxID=3346970 RepID=UPI003657023C